MAEKIIEGGGGLWIPCPILRGIGNPTLQNMLIDASGEKAAGIMRAPKDGDIAKVGFLTGTVTTGVTVDVRLETVNLATGDPSGTLLGTNSNGSQVIADGDDNTWFTVALTTAVTVTKGDLLAVVIANAGAGNMNIRNANIDSGKDFPYTDLFTAAWAKDNDSAVFSLEYSDGSYAHVPTVWPLSALNTETFNSSTSPDERGLFFQLPFPFRITGMWLVLDPDNAVDIVLYDSDGSTVLETVSIDPDLRISTSRKVFIVDFDGTQSLSKDTNYRLVVKPTTTSNVSINTLDVDAVAIMDSFAGGQKFHYTSRADAGSWTQVTTKFPIMGIRIDALDDGVGGGAASILSGGFGL